MIRNLGCSGLLALTITACAPASEKPVILDDTTARAVLAATVAGAERDGGDLGGFCRDYARSVTQCEEFVTEASQRCVLPGGEPTVTRSAASKSVPGSETGWVLEVTGHTEQGQFYTSDFFVVADGGKAKAAFGVYWTGLGLVESPFGPDNTRIPQGTCAPETSDES